MSGIDPFTEAHQRRAAILDGADVGSLSAGGGGHVFDPDDPEVASLLMSSEAPKCGVCGGEVGVPVNGIRLCASGQHQCGEDGVWKPKAAVDLNQLTDGELLLLAADTDHKIKCPKCDTEQLAKNEKCSKCGHSLAEARKAKFANLNASQEPDESHASAIWQPDLNLAENMQEKDGLIWKIVCKTGELALSPGPGQMDVEQPLKLTPDLFMAVREAWDDKAVQYVTIPETHANGTLENLGYVRDLKFMDQPTMLAQDLPAKVRSIVQSDPADTEYMYAGLDFTDTKAKQKAKEGSIADTSVGIRFNQRPNKQTGKLYKAVLEHVCVTNQPWFPGLGAFGNLSQTAEGEVYDQDADIKYDGVFASVPPVEVFKKPDDKGKGLSGIAEKLGISLDQLRDRFSRTSPEGNTQVVSSEDSHEDGEGDLLTDDETALLSQVMGNGANNGGNGNGSGEQTIEQILASQKAETEAAVATAAQTQTQLEAAQTILASQGRELHETRVEKKVKALDGKVPPAVLREAERIWMADYNPENGGTHSLNLSYERPRTGGTEGETEKVEFASATAVVDSLLASLPSSGAVMDAIALAADVQDLHASQQTERTAEQKADEIEREHHPDRFDSDGKRIPVADRAEA